MWPSDGKSVSRAGDDSTSDSDTVTDDINVLCNTYIDIQVRQLVLTFRPQRLEIGVALFGLRVDVYFYPYFFQGKLGEIQVVCVIILNKI